MFSRTAAWCLALFRDATDASAKASEPDTSSKILRALSVKMFDLAALALLEGVSMAAEADRFCALASGVASAAPPGPPGPLASTGIAQATCPGRAPPGRGWTNHVARRGKDASDSAVLTHSNRGKAVFAAELLSDKVVLETKSQDQNYKQDCLSNNGGMVANGRTGKWYHFARACQTLTMRQEFFRAHACPHVATHPKASPAPRWPYEISLGPTGSYSQGYITRGK